MLTVAVDCSLLTSRNPHNRPGVWAYVSSNTKKWGTTDLVYTPLIELLAVNKALEDFPDQDICIHCDVVGVQSGSKMFGKSRFRKKRVASDFRLIAASLWADYDKLIGGRKVEVALPPKKNKGLHGEAHALARRMVHNTTANPLHDALLVLCGLPKPSEEMSCSNG